LKKSANKQLINGISYLLEKIVMLKKQSLILIAVMLSSVFAFAQVTEAPKTAAHHVVLEMTTSDTMVWKGITNNIRNLRKRFDNDIEIEVVCHGGAISFLTSEKTTQATLITEFAGAGVQFSACENTMRQRKITKEQLLPVVQTVPSGAGEVVLKQEEGWSYLKIT